jgi:hypothetical protein
MYLFAGGNHDNHTIAARPSIRGGIVGDNFQSIKQLWAIAVAFIVDPFQACDVCVTDVVLVHALKVLFSRIRAALKIVSVGREPVLFNVEI